MKEQNGEFTKEDSYASVMAGGRWKLSEPSFQFHHEPKMALKNKAFSKDKLIIIY